MTQRAILEMTVNSPSKRFWVSEEQATIVVSSVLKGRDLSGMRPNKRDLYMEIYRRFTAYENRFDTPLCVIVSDIVNQPAPRFFLTAGSAAVIISKINTGWYDKRR